MTTDELRCPACGSRDYEYIGTIDMGQKTYSEHRCLRVCRQSFVEAMPWLRADVERLRAALAFYADKDNWETKYHPHTGKRDSYVSSPLCELDKGVKARAALEK
jgi:hypothetical protein